MIAHAVIGQEPTYLPYAIDSSFYRQVDSKVNDYMHSKKTFPAAVILATKDGKVVFEKAYGVQQRYDMGKSLKQTFATTPETLFDMASCTKVLATTQSIMKLCYEGKIDLKEKVTTYLPNFGQGGKEKITIEQLLTHTSGLAQWRPFYLYTNQKSKVLELIENEVLKFKDGKVHYSDLGFQTLGFIIEAVTGKAMDIYVETQLFASLGMLHTKYLPLQKGITKNEIAATSWGNPFEKQMIDEEHYPGFSYDCTKDKEAFEKFTLWREYTLVGEVNDGNAGMANAGVAGHAGLFARAKDIAILGQLMLNGGIYNDIRLYDEETLNLFTTNHTGNAKRGLGFELNASYMGKFSSMATFGHSGFTGTHLIFDKIHNVQIIILTNKQNNGLNKAKSYPSTYSFAREIAEIFQKKLF